MRNLQRILVILTFLLTLGVTAFAQAQAPVVDGKLDSVYLSSSATQTLMCDTTTLAGRQVGILYTFVDSRGNLYGAWVNSLGLVDNTYGANQFFDWPGKHSFNHLIGSDQCEFSITNGAGTVVMRFAIDYMSAIKKKGFPTLYKSLGVTGGDGRITIGSAANVVTGTSIDYNFNVLGCNTKTVDSPLLVDSVPPRSVYDVKSPPEPAHCDPWIFEVIYEFQVKAAAFGGKGIGTVTIPSQHISPNKLTTNVIYPIPCPPQQGTIMGQVRCAEDGSPLAGVPITLSGDASGTVFTNPDGTFEFTNLPIPGNYQVCAAGPYVDLNGNGVNDVMLMSPPCVNVSLSTSKPTGTVDYVYSCPSGSISGQVFCVDSSGVKHLFTTASIPVKITNTFTGEVTMVATIGGVYTSPPLRMGNYMVEVPALPDLNGDGGADLQIAATDTASKTRTLSADGGTSATADFCYVATPGGDKVLQVLLNFPSPTTFCGFARLDALNPVSGTPIDFSELYTRPPGNYTITSGLPQWIRNLGVSEPVGVRLDQTLVANTTTFDPNCPFKNLIGVRLGLDNWRFRFTLIHPFDGPGTACTYTPLGVLVTEFGGSLITPNLPPITPVVTDPVSGLSISVGSGVVMGPIITNVAGFTLPGCAPDVRKGGQAVTEFEFASPRGGKLFDDSFEFYAVGYYRTVCGDIIRFTYSPGIE